MERWNDTRRVILVDVRYPIMHIIENHQVTHLGQIRVHLVPIRSQKVQCNQRNCLVCFLKEDGHPLDIALDRVPDANETTNEAEVSRSRSPSTPSRRSQSRSNDRDRSNSRSRSRSRSRSHRHDSKDRRSRSSPRSRRGSTFESRRGDHGSE